MTYPNDPHSSDDVLDSRSLDKRLEELNSILDDCHENDDGEMIDDETNECMEDEREERDNLHSFIEEARQYTTEWSYGVQLINDDYFEEWTEQYANDVFDLPTSWPANHINWEAAAEDLKQDYTGVDWEGETFWLRSC